MSGVLDIEQDRIRESARDFLRVIPRVRCVQRSGYHQQRNLAPKRFGELNWAESIADGAAEMIIEERIVDGDAKWSLKSFSLNSLTAAFRKVGGTIYGTRHQSNFADGKPCPHSLNELCEDPVVTGAG